MKLRVSHLNIF